jgi:hypothetical protein
MNTGKTAYQQDFIPKAWSYPICVYLCPSVVSLGFHHIATMLFVVNLVQLKWDPNGNSVS